jgi:hypothetical protein
MEPPCVVAGPGFEFVPQSASKWVEALTSQKIKGSKTRKVA